MMEIGNIVVMANGIVGVVVGHKGKPYRIVTARYSTPVDYYIENGKHRSNDVYDIVEVRDGSQVENPDDCVFRKKVKVTELPLLKENKKD